MARILFLSPQPFYQWRGSPIRVAFNLMALSELGHEVDFLTLPVGEDKPIPRVRVLRVPNLFRVRSLPIGPSFLKLLFDGLMFLEGLVLIVRHRYDVIHGVEDAGAIGAVLAFFSRSRLIYEKHSDPSSYRRGPIRNLVMGAYAAVERFTARRARAVITTGPGLARQVRARQPDAAVHAISDIPSSLVEADPDKTRAARASLTRAEGEVLATYVGSFAVYQGVDLMFEAMARLAGRLNVRFIVIGGTPAAIEERKRWLAARSAANQVTFIEKIAPDELPVYLAASDLLLSPRISGVNTPLKLLDYFKARGAIVATDTEANRLILSDETACLTAPDAASFADGIRRLVEDEALRERLAAAGRRQVDERYNFAEFKRLLAACYAEVLHPPHETPREPRHTT